MNEISFCSLLVYFHFYKKKLQIKYIMMHIFYARTFNRIAPVFITQTIINILTIESVINSFNHIFFSPPQSVHNNNWEQEIFFFYPKNSYCKKIPRVVILTI